MWQLQLPAAVSKRLQSSAAPRVRQPVSTHPPAAPAAAQLRSPSQLQVKPADSLEMLVHILLPSLPAISSHFIIVPSCNKHEQVHSAIKYDSACRAS